ncbi:transposase [Chryseobacterium ginsenosidimutans]|uniref:transposase n=1 Tax=Chryseobacterium ginsenosidimutans TaxID=687846 RepID=UPI0031E014F3
MGNLISQRVKERGFDSFRICKFLKCTDPEWKSMQSQKSLDTDIVLKLSILLEYDFFRIYSQYLILYAPQANVHYNNVANKQSLLPYYRKNIYTKEVVDFILEQIENGAKTKAQIIEEYKIPKTTLYKWISKYHQFKKQE